MALDRLRDRPKTLIAKPQRGRSGLVRASKSGRAGQRKLRLAAVSDIKKGKREIARIGRERLGALRAGILPRAHGCRARGQLAQQRQLTFADDARRVVAVGAEYPADSAVIVGDRAVGESVVGLFRIAVP